MTRIFGILIGFLVVLLLAYPFAQKAYNRYLVSEHLKSVMTAQERAEFRNWNGDAMEFAKTLQERCELSHGQGAVQCGRYRPPPQ